MACTFNEEQFSKILPSCKNYLEWYNVVQTELPKYNIDSRLRVGAFLAQCGHESLDFNILTENMNYSAEGLVKVFPKYFKTMEEALPYHRQPEKIGNRVYSNRMGNGNEASGDGYKFRGRGAIQITGKNNYRASSIFLFNDEQVLDRPGYYATPEGAIRSACWFWTANNLNAIADNSDNLLLTMRINGGTIGIADRQRRYDLAMLIL